jgi:hypothetical protein
MWLDWALLHWQFSVHQESRKVLGVNGGRSRELVSSCVQRLQVSLLRQASGQQRLRQHEAGGGGHLRTQQTAPTLQSHLDRMLTTPTRGAGYRAIRNAEILCDYFRRFLREPRRGATVEGGLLSSR